MVGFVIQIDLVKRIEIEPGNKLFAQTVREQYFVESIFNLLIVITRRKYGRVAQKRIDLSRDPKFEFLHKKRNVDGQQVNIG